MYGRPLINLAIMGLFVGFAAACAGPHLERLDGEPKSARAYTVSPDKRIAPAVDGIERFIRAMDTGTVESAFLQLSAATRSALNQRAKVMGKRGFDLLRKPAAGMSPGEQALHIIDPVAVFAMRKPASMKAGPPPYPAHKPADGRTIEQKVVVVGANGSKKVLTMRFEGLHWRIHRPAINAPVEAGP